MRSRGWRRVCGLGWRFGPSWSRDRPQVSPDRGRESEGDRLTLPTEADVHRAAPGRFIMRRTLRTVALTGAVATLAVALMSTSAQACHGKKKCKRCGGRQVTVVGYTPTVSTGH